MSAPAISSVTISPCWLSWAMASPSSMSALRQNSNPSTISHHEQIFFHQTVLLFCIDSRRPYAFTMQKEQFQPRRLGQQRRLLFEVYAERAGGRIRQRAVGRNHHQGQLGWVVYCYPGRLQEFRFIQRKRAF